MKKIVLATAFIMFSSLAMAEKGPWELVEVQNMFNFRICYYQRVETINTWNTVQNAYTIGYNRCIPPLF